MKNTGTREGDEVVQLYVRYSQSKVSRPMKELKGFQRIHLKPGETKTAQFSLQAMSLAWWNEAQVRFEVEEGPIHIMIGTSSEDIRSKTAAIVR